MYDSQGVSLAAALSDIEKAKEKIRIIEAQIAQTALDRSYKQTASVEVFFVIALKNPIEVTKILDFILFLRKG